jgi:hypothetical protein
MMIVIVPIFMGMVMIMGMGLTMVMVGVLMVMIMRMALPLMGLVIQRNFFPASIRAETLDGNGIGRFSAAFAHGLVPLEMIGARGPLASNYIAFINWIQVVFGKRGHQCGTKPTGAAGTGPATVH